MNPSTIGARVLLDELVRLGVREIVLCPGSRSAPLAYAAHALETAGRIRLHVRVDERSAAFLALGLAKETRRPAAVVTTSGTAVANLHPAVLEAHHGAVPLLLLTADRPPELRGVGANQATDQLGIFGDAVRLALDLETPSDPVRQAASWRTSAGRAHAAATGAVTGAGMAGPVQLNIPFRDPLVPQPGRGSPARLCERGYLESAGGAAEPDLDRGNPARLSERGYLESAGEAADPVGEGIAGRPDGRPWVQHPAAGPLVGGVTPLPHDPDTLVVIGELPTAQHRAIALDWAAHQGAPVIAEPGPGHHGLLLPHGTQLLGATDWVAANLPSRLLVIGRPTLGRAIPNLTRHPDVRVEVVTTGEPGAHGWPDATHTARAVHPFAALATDEGEGAASPRSHQGTPFARTWLDAAERAARALSGRQTTHLDGPAAARAVHDALPTGAALFLGSSSVARDVHLGIAHPRPDVLPVTGRGLAGIDGCVSTAVGLALSRPGRPTAALLGDLTLLHDTNGMLIGPDEPRPDLTLVVVDDDGGSIFGTLEYGAEELAGPLQRIFTTPTGTDIESLCAAHGVPCTSVADAAELAAAVTEPARGIRVVRVPIDGARRRQQAAEDRATVRAALTG